MSVPSQDYSAAITWQSDWTNHLAANGNLTITAGTATCADNRVTVSSQTHTNTAILFKVTQNGITTPTRVNIVVGVTLSNGDTDQRNFPIQFTDT